MIPVTRRGFLKTVGLGGAGLAFSGLRPLIGSVIARTPTYTGVSYLTPAYQALMFGVNGFIANLEQEHADAVRVDFFDSGMLMKADEQVSALRQGIIQFMFHTTSYITRSFPILGITGLPGLCDELYRHGERIAMESPLWTLINDRLGKDKLFMLTAGGGILEPEFVWSGKNRVASLGDLKGKRCRVVSYEATEILKSFGVAGVRIPSSETYIAIQRGTVDAAVANISTIIGRRLYEQIRYCYQLPVTGFSIGIFLLKDAWERMPANAKIAFWEAARWYDQNHAKTVNGQFYAKEYWPMLRKKGIEIFEPTEAERRTFEENAEPLRRWWRKQVGEDVGAKAIHLALGEP
jgi:TRAP-type C4-dicarboxylate transport system substrate-binding protein